jgi:hypothetical protein
MASPPTLGFGSPNPANSTSGFGFGGPNPATSTSVFGQAPAGATFPPRPALGGRTTTVFDTMERMHAKIERLQHENKTQQSEKEKLQRTNKKLRLKIEKLQRSNKKLIRLALDCINESEDVNEAEDVDESEAEDVDESEEEDVNESE